MRKKVKKTNYTHIMYNIDGKFEKTVVIKKMWKTIDAKMLPVTWENKRALVTTEIYHKCLQNFAKPNIIE